MINNIFKYQVCNRCIMDSTAIDIIFNSNGFCNFCSDFLTAQNNNNNYNNLSKFIEKIKIDGKNKKYDCIVGVSGGVDSCFALLKAVENNLRPLAVHMDNGWNSELAQNNISNLIRTLKVDLHTHVINWEEYRNFQKAFLEANVIDIELLYDNAMMSVNYRLANKFSIKYILSGNNTSTEGFKIPSNWSWFKNDAKNIKKIGKKFSNQEINTFPTFSTFNFIYYQMIKKIKWISFLNYFNYNKEKAIKELEEKTNFKKYPYKHYENIFTRFYQAYILPKKFGVDKRKLHLSNLIMSNQISRTEALKIIQQPCYPDIHEERKDLEYFLKKIKWDKEKLNEYISQKEIYHNFYGSEKHLWDTLVIINQKIKSFKNFFKI